MKLFHSNASPYVRKVIVTAIEKGVADKLEKVTATMSPIKCDTLLNFHNPLGKIPCLITDNSEVLFDSPVICAYLDSLHAPYLTPSDPKMRLAAMRLEALADGLLDAGLLLRYETTLRPEAKRWDDWINGQMAKVMAALDAMNTIYFKDISEQVTLGAIACGCALGWLDFRFGHINWRNSHRNLAAWANIFFERPSMKITRPYV